MTQAEYSKIYNNDIAIKITYETSYSKGVIEIDKIIYLKKIKKFQKLFKDCYISSFEEVKKPPKHMAQKGFYNKEVRYE